MTNNESLNQIALALEQKTLDLIQSGNWAALDAMIAPECQFVTNDGVFDKSAAMSLMQAMHLTDASIRNVHATSNGDTLIVSFELACAEFVNGQRQSENYRPRLSVWKKYADKYQCMAYGDFNRT
ncbi:MAG: hypothetical protein RIQ55_398 [Pseudomonadota bacterium]|jgi:hypothetical protein